MSLEITMSVQPLAFLIVLMSLFIDGTEARGGKVEVLWEGHTKFAKSPL